MLLILSLLTCFCPSVCGVAVAELSFEELGLDRAVSEALSEEVLRLVAATVPAVAHHRHHHLLVARVVREHPLVALAQVVEVVLGGGFRLKQLRLHGLRLRGVNRQSALRVLVS